MKLTAKEDIEAPIAFVNSILTDFDAWERAAMRRGADVQRLDSLLQPGPGMEWKASFAYRSKNRDLEIKLLKLIAEQNLLFDCSAKPVVGTLNIDLAEMGPRRTRMVVSLDVKPRTLAARLFMQTVKLAKAKVTRRFALRLSQLAADIEDRYRAKIKS